MHERTISAGVVWCMYCTCNTVQGLGRASPSPAQSFVGLSANITFHALLTILFPSSMLPTLFFPRFIEKYETHVENVYLQCALHCGYSPFNNALSSCLFVLYWFPSTPSPLEMFYEFLIHSSHKCYSPNIHFVRFHLKGRFMYLFVFCFAPLIVNGTIFVFEQLFYSLKCSQLAGFSKF